MDPITHTLVGACLAESGLKRRTALGSATLVIGANLPDIDVIAYFWGPVTALSFRRGLTHGVLGVAVLPLLLAASILVWDRAVRRRCSGTGITPVRTGWILALSYVAVATHPLLDFLNVYGVRWLMPFSAKWFYGDTLFIVDLWLWLILGLGVATWKTRGGKGERETVAGGRSPWRARMALLWATAYMAAMAGIAVVGRMVVQRAAEESELRPLHLMVSPEPLNPFKRWVVLENVDGYTFGVLNLLSNPRFKPFGVVYEKHPRTPAAVAASRTSTAQLFNSWSRFPYYVTEDLGNSYLVHIGDARYTLDAERSWAAVSVLIEKAEQAEQAASGDGR